LRFSLTPAASLVAILMVSCRCLCQVGQAERHSAYRSQFVVVEYPWHPLYGERLRLYQRTGRRGQQILYLQVRADISREVPAWMCDAAACAAMSIGPPQVGVDALNELRSVLTAHSPESMDRGSSGSAN
jgi:hypothetical protein